MESLIVTQNKTDKRGLLCWLMSTSQISSSSASSACVAVHGARAQMAATACMNVAPA